MTAVNNLDYVGDLIEVNMVDLGMRRVEKGFKISAATQEVLETLHVVVFDALKAAVRAVVEEDKDYANRVINIQDDINLLVAKADLHQAARLVSKDSGKFEAYSVEVDIIEKLKRIYKYAREMAKTVVGEEEKATIKEAA